MRLLLTSDTLQPGDSVPGLGHVVDVSVRLSEVRIRVHEEPTILPGGLWIRGTEEPRRTVILSKGLPVWIDRTSGGVAESGCPTHRTAGDGRVCADDAA